MSDDNDETGASSFNAMKYFEESQVSVGGKRFYLADGSDMFANQQKMFISFQHTPTGKSVFFKAFITAFNETYNSDWASETVYGRADPIYLFKNTQRKIVLTFKIPAYSTSEAYENLGKVQQLVQFLYPNYTNVQEAQTISQSPLIRLKVMNLLRNTNDRFSDMDKNYAASATDSSPYTATGDKMKDYSNLQTWQSHDGLLGAVDNLTVNHNLEGDDGSFVVGQNALLPKLLDIQLSFSPVHEHALGWDETGIFGANSNRSGQQRLFPYGVALKDDSDEHGLVNPATYTPNGQSFVQKIKDESQNEDREVSEAALANAEAQFSGMFGTMRLKSALRSGDQGAQDYAQSQFDAGEYSDGEEGLTKQGQRVVDAYYEGQGGDE